MQLAVVDEEVAVVGIKTVLRIKLLGRVVEHRVPVVDRHQSFLAQPVEVVRGGREVSVLGWLALERGAVERAVVAVDAAVAIDQHQRRLVDFDVGAAVALGEQIESTERTRRFYACVSVDSSIVSAFSVDRVLSQTVESVLSRLQVARPVECQLMADGVGRRVDLLVADLHGLVGKVGVGEIEPTVAKPLGMVVLDLRCELYALAGLHGTLKSHALVVGHTRGVENDLTHLVVGEIVVVAIVAIAGS